MPSVLVYTHTMHTINPIDSADARSHSCVQRSLRKLTGVNQQHNRLHSCMRTIMRLIASPRPGRTIRRRSHTGDTHAHTCDMTIILQLLAVQAHWLWNILMKFMRYAFCLVGAQPSTAIQCTYIPNLHRLLLDELTDRLRYGIVMACVCVCVCPNCPKATKQQ